MSVGSYALDLQAVGLREGEEGLDKPFACGDPLQRPWNIIADTDEGRWRSSGFKEH